MIWKSRYIIVALNRSRRKSCNLRMERVAFASKTNTWLTLNGNNPEDSKVSNILVDILCPTVFHQSSSAAQDANAPAISVILTDLWIPLESLVVTFNSTHSIINKTEISKPNPWSGWKKNKVWAETSNRLILKKQHFLSRFASFASHELVEAPAAQWSARSCLWPQDIGSGGDNPSLFLLSPKLHQHNIQYAICVPIANKINKQFCMTLWQSCMTRHPFSEFCRYLVLSAPNKRHMSVKLATILTLYMAKCGYRKWRHIIDFIGQGAPHPNGRPSPFSSCAQTRCVGSWSHLKSSCSCAIWIPMS